MDVVPQIRWRGLVWDAGEDEVDDEATSSTGAVECAIGEPPIRRCGGLDRNGAGGGADGPDEWWEPPSVVVGAWNRAEPWTAW